MFFIADANNAKRVRNKLIEEKEKKPLKFIISENVIIKQIRAVKTK